MPKKSQINEYSDNNDQLNIFLKLNIALSYNLLLHENIVLVPYDILSHCGNYSDDTYE